MTNPTPPPGPRPESDTPRTDAQFAKQCLRRGDRDFAAYLERDLAAAQAEVEKMKVLATDSNAVHVNMLRGTLARLSWEQTEHLLGPHPLRAERDRLRAALGELKNAARLYRSVHELTCRTDASTRSRGKKHASERLGAAIMEAESLAGSAPDGLRYFKYIRTGFRVRYPSGDSIGHLWSDSRSTWEQVPTTITYVLREVALGRAVETDANGTPLPKVPVGVPPLTGEFADFEYWGVGPLTNPPPTSMGSSWDIAAILVSRGGGWMCGWNGCSSGYHYAIRRGTALHAANFKEGGV
jgi:hypothetical protein